MSEYQYYEFVAADGPISDDGMQYAQGCSSRADVSRFRWCNVYNYGDFHGSVDTMLKYYDAHFYISNWGSTYFYLAIPRDCLNFDAIKIYLRSNDPYEQTLSVENTDDRCIVKWKRNEEGGDGWTDGEGIIDDLIDIREELLRGDCRSLFLGWLADFYPDEWQDFKDSGVLVPPIPGGLDSLSTAQNALIEQFPVDPDALTSAAGQSRQVKSERIPMSAVLDTLDASKMKSLLQRVAEGEGLRVMSELNRLTYPPVRITSEEVLTCVDFSAKVIDIRKDRLEKEAKAAAAKRQREFEARKQHLASVMKRAKTIWADLDLIMVRKNASDYDNVAAQLKELSHAYKQAEKEIEFRDILSQFQKRYKRRSAMMRRIKDL